MTYTIEMKNVEFKQSDYIAGALVVRVNQYFVGSDEFVMLHYRDQDKDSFMQDFHEFVIDELVVTNDDNGNVRRWERGEDGKFKKPVIVKYPLPSTLVGGGPNRSSVALLKTGEDTLPCSDAT